MLSYRDETPFALIGHRLMGNSLLLTGEIASRRETCCGRKVWGYHHQPLGTKGVPKAVASALDSNFPADSGARAPNCHRGRDSR
jgi:hypothetical protein